MAASSARRRRRFGLSTIHCRREAVSRADGRSPGVGSLEVVDQAREIGADAHHRGATRPAARSRCGSAPCCSGPARAPRCRSPAAGGRTSTCRSPESPLRRGPARGSCTSACRERRPRGSRAAAWAQPRAESRRPRCLSPGCRKRVSRSSSATDRARPKSRTLTAPLRREHDVAGLEVAVDHAALVGGDEHFGDLLGDAHLGGVVELSLQGPPRGSLPRSAPEPGSRCPRPRCSRRSGRCGGGAAAKGREPPGGSASWWRLPCAARGATI